MEIYCEVCQVRVLDTQIVSDENFDIRDPNWAVPCEICMETAIHGKCMTDKNQSERTLLRQNLAEWQCDECMDYINNHESSDEDEVEAGVLE